MPRTRAARQHDEEPLRSQPCRHCGAPTERSLYWAPYDLGSHWLPARTLVACELCLSAAKATVMLRAEEQPPCICIGDAYQVWGLCSEDGCGRWTRRIVTNGHHRYAHCSWSRPYCADCWPSSANDGRVGPLGDCIDVWEP